MCLDCQCCLAFVDNKAIVEIRKAKVAKNKPPRRVRQCVSQSALMLWAYIRY